MLSHAASTTKTSCTLLVFGKDTNYALNYKFNENKIPAVKQFLLPEYLKHYDRLMPFLDTYISFALSQIISRHCKPLNV